MTFVGNWVRNAIATQLGGIVKAEIEAAREAERREVRQLVQEMDDVLEKFTRVVAREAMRRSRETKKAMEENPTVTASPSAVPADRRAALRQRLGIGVGARALPLPPHTEGNGT